MAIRSCAVCTSPAILAFLALPIVLAPALAYGLIPEARPVRCSEPVDLLKAAGLASGVTPGGLSSQSVHLGILGADLCRVTVYGHVPPRDLVFARVGAAWSLILDQGIQAVGWRDAVGCLLSTGPRAPQTEDPAALARELAQVLVDPDTRWGVVLHSQASIPTSYDFSGRRSYLLRVMGMSVADASLLMLSKAPTTIPPPVMRDVGGGKLLEFHTWQYLGGEVVRWQVHLGANSRIDRRSLATEVGSYGTRE
jgi:hypothetical protein